jgi:hypothetical protein
LTNLRRLYLQNNFLTGTIPTELCNLNLDDLEVTCGAVQCDCCTSCDPGNDRRTPSPGQDPILDLILSNIPDGGLSLQDPNSPQSAALAWLQQPANSQGFSDERLLQRYALATIYYSTGGDAGSWSATTLWLTGANECDWYTTSDTGSICSGDGNNGNVYRELDLRQNGLVGTLPDEISMLTGLQSIRLNENTITGTLPPSIADLPSLQHLDMSTNQLVGNTSPVQTNNVFNNNPDDDDIILNGRLEEMQSLTHLSLFQNLYQATIPSSLGLLSSNLRVLDLGSNSFYGTIPSEIGRLTRLAGLSLFDNGLTGRLPVELSGLTMLEMLYIDSNDLGPPVPTGVCELADLREFWADCDEMECTCCTKCCVDETGCA